MEKRIKIVAIIILVIFILLLIRIYCIQLLHSYTTPSDLKAVFSLPRAFFSILET